MLVSVNVLISGATGFVGSALSAELAAQGHSVRGFSRAKGPGLIQWDPCAAKPPAEAFEGVGAVVHLAGESVVGLWTQSKRKAIRDSRVDGTKNLVAGLADLDQRPHTLISASAIGYYGDRGEEELTEDSSPGEGFLTDTCLAWEQAASEAEDLGLRVVRLRIGIVLAAGGGALGAMRLPFRLGLGGPLGDGRQWSSWITRSDLVRLILFSLENQSVSGALNGTAPEPRRQRAFAKALGRALSRPAFLPVPAFALRLILGGFSTELLSSKKVLPRAAESHGFEFRQPSLEPALREIF